MSDLRTSAIRLAATMPKGSEERKALLTVLAAAQKCDGADGCDKPLAYIDSKGYVYCQQHGDSLKSAGRKGVRKLKPGEAKNLDKSAADKEASDTWNRRIEPLKAQFLREVMAEAESILGDAGATNMRQTATNYITGTIAGEKFSVFWLWQFDAILSKMSLGSANRNGRHEPLSMSPMNVAAESIYKHFQGLLP